MSDLVSNLEEKAIRLIQDGKPGVAIDVLQAVCALRTIGEGD